MIKNFYAKLILKYPKRVLLLILFFVLVMGYFATKLEVDASSDTIILENDSDLLFFKETNKQFNSNDFLVIAFTPKKELLSDSTLQTIKNLTTKLKSLKEVSSITSILNAPILINSNLKLKDLVDKVPTLQDNHISKDIAKKALSHFKQSGYVFTPDEYKKVFCQEAKRAKVIIQDCNKVAEYITKLDKKYQLIAKNYNIKNVDELIIFLINYLNREDAGKEKENLENEYNIRVAKILESKPEDPIPDLDCKSPLKK